MLIASVTHTDCNEPCKAQPEWQEKKTLGLTWYRQRQAPFSKLPDSTQSKGEEARSVCMQNASLIGFAVSQGNLVGLLQGGCLCAWPHFGAKFAEHVCKITVQPVSSPP